jgi:serine/threonine protein kinase
MARVFGGKWRHVRDLTGGGQAHTFEVRNAVDTSDQKAYALKRLKNIKRIERFRREVDIIRRLNHPNIVQIVDADLEAEKPFLVSEFCEGGSLADASLNEFSLHELLSFFRETCEAVCASHEQGITHRDIKPDNILLRTSRGPAVLADFGLSYVENGERQTLVEEAVGPRLYMAPELEDGRADLIAPASDIYSLGKLLYFLVSRGRIFAREKHRDTKYDLVRQHNDERFEHINILLDRMIVFSAESRFQSACELPSLIERTDRLLEGGFRTLNRPPEKCLYCGDGAYALLPTQSQYDQMQQLGFTTPGTVMWRVFVCDNCGNVLWFRPDKAGKNREWLD